MPIKTGTPSKSQTGGDTTSHSWSHTVAVEPNTVLVAQCVLDWISGGGPNTIAATYNGVSMTRFFETGDKDRFIAQFILSSPATGSNTLAFTWVGSSYFAGLACAFSGVNLPSPYLVGSSVTNTGTSSSPTVDIPSVRNGLVIDCLGLQPGGSTITVNGSQTEITRESTAGGDTLVAMSYEVGNGSNVTMSWSSTGSPLWYTGGFCLSPISEGSNVAVSPFLSL